MEQIAYIQFHGHIRYIQQLVERLGRAIVGLVLDALEFQFPCRCKLDRTPERVPGQARHVQNHNRVTTTKKSALPEEGECWRAGNMSSRSSLTCLTILRIRGYF